MENKATLTGVLMVGCNGSHKSIASAYEALLALGLKEVQIFCKEGFLAGPEGDIVFAVRLPVSGLKHGRSTYFIETIIDGLPSVVIPASENVKLCVSGFGE